MGQGAGEDLQEEIPGLLPGPLTFLGLSPEEQGPGGAQCPTYAD